MIKFENLVPGDKAWYGYLWSKEVHPNRIVVITKIEKKTDSSLEIFYKFCEGEYITDPTWPGRSIWVHGCEYYRVTKHNDVFTPLKNAEKLLPLWSAAYMSGEENIKSRLRQLLGVEE